MYLLRETEYAPALAPRVATVEIPNTHYSVPMFDDPLSQVTISLAVRLQGSSANTLRLLWNNLIGRLYMGTNRPINVLRTRDTVVEQADAKLISTSAPDFDCGRNRLDATIVLALPGGGWRGDYVEQQLGDGDNQSLTTIVNSTRPISDAMLRVLGPMDVLEVYDVTSRTGIRWDRSTTVPSLQYLLVDVASMQARIQTTQTLGHLAGHPRRRGPDLHRLPAADADPELGHRSQYADRSSQRDIDRGSRRSDHSISVRGGVTWDVTT